MKYQEKQTTINKSITLMKKIQNKTKYITPECETLNFLVEGAILTASSDKSGNSLGELEDNNIFGETFI